DRRRRVAHRRRDLEHRLHQLGVDARLELVPVDGREHRVDVLDEIERLGVEEHVLLLDSERIGVALSEGVVEHAAAFCEAAALAADRRWEDLLHAVPRPGRYAPRAGPAPAQSGSSASASISTRQLGSSSAATTMKELAGRMSAKTSPCA